MLRAWRGNEFKHLESARIRAQKHFPLLECFISMFMEETLALTRQGLAHSYVEEEANLPFVKGKIDFPGQLRHNLVHQERCYVRYDAFSANRPVNRLLKSTLLLLQRLSRDARNQGHIRQARFYLDEIPVSLNLHADLARARVDRTMPHYARLFPWIRLFLQGANPVTYRGTNPAPALLFPMEQVFEDYVAYRMRREPVLKGWRLSEQERKYHLVERNSYDKPEFSLRPDVVMRGDGQTFIMDAKWKRLDHDREDANIRQGDLYQLYAYGNKYRHAEGPCALFLLYPRSKDFPYPFRRLLFDADLPLWVLTVDPADEARPVFSDALWREVRDRMQARAAEQAA